MEQVARWLMMAGVAVFVVGIALYFAPWLLNWFGKLPGDIRIETRHSKVFFPITSMLIISVVLSIIINIFRK